MFPYEGSKLIVRIKKGAMLHSGRKLSIKVYPSNNIRLYCGAVSSATYRSDSYESRVSFASSAFTTAIPTVLTRFALEDGVSGGDTSYHEEFSHFPQIGEGCANLDDCSGNGICDYCSQTCFCDMGFGNPADFAQRGRDVASSCATSKYTVMPTRSSASALKYPSLMIIMPMFVLYCLCLFRDMPGKQVYW